jgi:amino acid transporter
MISHLLDQFSLLQVFLGSFLLMLVFLEIGFRLGTRPSGKFVKAQTAQVRAIMGATLGLSAFLLAFTFSVVQSHYETRVENMVEEARLARHAFLQAEKLPQPYRSEAREILHHYIADRVRIDELAQEHRIDEIVALVVQSEQMQQRLWQLALDSEEAALEGDTLAAGFEPYRGHVLGLIDIHAMRIQAAVMNRISWVIWLALYLTAALSMLITGFQAGLTTRRSPIATMTLALAFSLVLILIVDLDRPMMSLFHVDNHVMHNLLDQMKRISAP